MKRTIIRNNGRPQTIRERELKQSPDEWGYPQVGLNRKTYKVHRLMARTFLGERPEGCEIRHLDGNPANNNLSNLCYGTHSENIMDRYSYAGKVKKDQKLTKEKARQIKLYLADGHKNRDIAKLFGVSEQTVCDIKHGRAYKGVEL